MDSQEENLNKLKDKFKVEIKGITDIDDLKDLFASEIARRDLIIEELKQQNEVLLKSAFKEKKSAVLLNKE